MVRTAAQVATLALQLCTLVVTGVVAYAAIKGIQTLEARKERDKAAKEASDERLAAEEFRKVAGRLNEEIAALDAQRLGAQAELEETRLRLLQADAREKQAAARLQAATSESRRYSLIAEFYGRVSKACVATRDRRSSELCIANVLAKDPEFQQLSRADAKTILARAAPPVPTVTLSANPHSAGVNAAATLTWSSTNASGCTASGGWTGAKATSGMQTVGPLMNTTTYTVRCTGAGGNASDSETVTVGPLVAGNYQPGESGGGHMDPMLLATILAVASRRRRRRKVVRLRRSRRST